VIPREYLDKLYLSRMFILPDTEDRTIVSSFVWSKHRNVTDGQTDREICRGYSDLHCEQFGRAVKKLLIKN